MFFDSYKQFDPGIIDCKFSDQNMKKFHPLALRVQGWLNQLIKYKSSYSDLKLDK